MTTRLRGLVHPLPALQPGPRAGRGQPDRRGQAPHQLPVGGGLAARQPARPGRPLHPPAGGRAQGPEHGQGHHQRDHDLPPLPPARLRAPPGGRCAAAGARAPTTWSSTRRARASPTPSPGWPTAWPPSTTTQDQKVYDAVVVLTDRKVLDQQLQNTIYQFEHKTGVVEKIDTDSAQLAAALAAGVPIIISTIHKFGFIQDKIQDLPGPPLRRHRRRGPLLPERRDGRHRQGAARPTAPSRPSCEEEGEDLAAPDQLALRAALFRGPQPNISFFAFTATPKYKTLELFGHKGAGRQARALPPLLHAPGHRGGLHPRRAPGLHHLQALLPARQGRRRRPGAGQAQGRRGPGPLRQPAPDQHRPEDRDHHRALPLLCDAQAPAAAPRPWW